VEHVDSQVLIALTTRVVSRILSVMLAAGKELALITKAYAMLSQNLFVSTVKEFLFIIAKMAAGLAKLTLRQGGRAHGWFPPCRQVSHTVPSDMLAAED